MRRVQLRPVLRGPAVGVLCVATLLTVLALTGDLSPVGWLTGLAAGVTGCALLARGLARRVGGNGYRDVTGMGPADRVTLARLVLTCGVAALAAASLAQGGRGVALLVMLATVAQLLDSVDGRVARRTSSVSELGARFDMETDAFLILVLSVYVADAMGWWVLAIGLARYAFLAAGWVWPWLRGTAPPRYWCKVVAVLQGAVLTLVVAGPLPALWETGLVTMALVLLTESFGREAWQLWERRPVIETWATGGEWGEPVAAGRVASGLSDA
ncbi:MAG: CDP-alcohol phosphatidyltransferase family protein [Nocardioidaceae bacterium]